MNCPKCGVAQEGEREECSSCGIIFARWREAQDRAFLDHKTAQNIVVPEVEPGLPRWVIGVGLLVVVLFGVTWTVRRREARASVNLAAEGKAKLNEINRAATKQRLLLEDEATRARRMKMMTDGDKVATATRPSGFSEEDATRLLHDCSGFETPVGVKLPKNYSSDFSSTTDDRYPALADAHKSGLLETSRDGSLVTNTLGIRAAGMRVAESDTEFEFDLGWRQVQSILELTGTADSAEAEFRWAYQNRSVAEMLLPATDYGGTASFLLKDGQWRVLRASARGGGRTVDLCKD